MDYNFLHRRLAQLGERLFYTQIVTGSIPVSPTTISNIMTRNIKRFKDMKMKTRDKIIKVSGWLVSATAISAGMYLLFPRIHIALVGGVLVYLGFRIFNFSTFEEYKEKRMNFVHRWLN